MVNRHIKMICTLTKTALRNKPTQQVKKIDTKEPTAAILYNSVLVT